MACSSGRQACGYPQVTPFNDLLVSKLCMYCCVMSYMCMLVPTLNGTVCCLYVYFVENMLLSCCRHLFTLEHPYYNKIFNLANVRKHISLVVTPNG